MSVTAKKSVDSLFINLDEQASVDYVAKKFKLQQQGGVDGKDNLPKSDSNIMSPTELALVGHYNEIATKAFNLYNSNIGRLIEERTNLSNELNINENLGAIKRIQEQFKPKIFHSLEDNKQKINAKAIEFGDLIRNFKNFQLQNQLTSRTPNYPISNLSHFKWILAGALIELILAVFFYMEASSTPLSGILFGFLVVVINVLLSFISGDRLRFINHKELNLKLPYVGLSIIMFLCFLTAIIIAAHLRQAIVNVISNPDLANSTIDLMGKAGQQAWLTAKESPFSFGSDATSVLFFLASLGFGVLVCWKGYTRDDEYPGYGEIDRQKNRKELELQAAKENLFTEIKEILNSNKSELKKVFTDSVARCEMIMETITDHRLQLAHASKKFKHYENNLNNSISVYRAANQFVRSTDSPSFFSENLSLESEHHSELQTITKSEEDVESSLKGQIQQLTDAFNTASSELSSYEGEVFDDVHTTINQVISNATNGIR